MVCKVRDTHTRCPCCALCKRRKPAIADGDTMVWSPAELVWCSLVDHEEVGTADWFCEPEPIGGAKTRLRSKGANSCLCMAGRNAT